MRYEIPARLVGSLPLLGLVAVTCVGAVAGPPTEIRLSDSSLEVSGASGFARAVANAGDIDRDGFDETLVGAENTWNGGDDAGAIYVLYGNPQVGRAMAQGGLTRSIANMTRAKYYSLAHSAFLGASVAGNGDVNGDGRPDVLAGAPDDLSALLALGSVYLKLGASIQRHEREPLVRFAAWRASEHGEFLGLGGKRMLLTDLNGDDLDDVVLGASGKDNDSTATVNNGAVYVRFARFPQFDGRLEDDYDLRILGTGQVDQLGETIASGDLDGDGTRDLAIGVPFFDSDFGGVVTFDVGKAVVFYGGQDFDALPPNINDGQADASYIGTRAVERANVGSSLATGDLNGDQFDDLAIGAVGEKAVYIVWGGPRVSGRHFLGSHVSKLTGLGADFAAHLAMQLDFNGDGFADLAIMDDSNVHVVLGYETMADDLGTEAVEDFADYRFHYSTAGTSRVVVVAAGGDVDGNGTDELLVGTDNNNLYLLTSPGP